MKFRFLAVAALCAAAQGAPGQTLSWQVGSGNSANAGGAVDVLGITFTPSADRLATHLGYYDDTFISPDGLAISHEVGIYDTTTQQLVTSAVVPAGTTAPKINKFRMVALPTPVRLVGGRTYIVAGVTGSDPTRNISVSTGSLIPDAGVAVGDWVAAFTTSLSYPTFVFSTTTTRVGPVVGYGAAPATGMPAWSLGPLSTSTTGTPSITGIEFSVNRALDVTGVGFYDDTFSSPDGLSASHEVGVYDVATEASLTRALVPAGTGAQLIGRHRYVPAPTVRLIPGRRYVVAFEDGGDPGATVAPSSFTRLPGVVMHAWRVGFPGPLSFPEAIIPTVNFQAGGGVLLAERCPVDVDASNTATVQDIFDYLASWFETRPWADFDGNGSVTIQDVFDFLARWFEGC